MVKSMTGYGRGEAANQGIMATVEVRAVNNRYLDCSVKLPRTCLYVEDAIKERVQAKAARGKVDVFVNLAHTGGDDLTVSVNVPLAQAYLDALWELHQLGKGEMIRTDFYATDLARFPDVLTVEKKEDDQETLKEVLLAALELALADFDAMRKREGARLRDDILSRCERIEQLVEIVEERSPDTVTEYRAKLEAKMREVLAGAQIDESRVLTEAAVFADRVAVDEETVRLRSHIEQIRYMLEDGGAVGRKLDFLIQELNREANTIGSKCSDLAITRKVVDIKAEIEKIREQVQNIE